MHRRHTRRLTAAALFAAISAVSCHQYSPDTMATQPQSVDLFVHNDGFLDANVYAALPNGARGARLGTVTGSSTARLSVRLSDLWPNNILVLRVHGIGARNDWLSQSITIQPPDYAELRLLSGASGDYRFSNLYSRVR